MLKCWSADSIFWYQPPSNPELYPPIGPPQRPHISPPLPKGMTITLELCAAQQVFMAHWGTDYVPDHWDWLYRFWDILVKKIFATINCQRQFEKQWSPCVTFLAQDFQKLLLQVLADFSTHWLGTNVQCRAESLAQESICYPFVLSLTFTLVSKGSLFLMLPFFFWWPINDFPALLQPLTALQAHKKNLKSPTFKIKV